MGLFDRFKKKEDSVLPSDVDDYYKSELKTRRGSSGFDGAIGVGFDAGNCRWIVFWHASYISYF